MKPLEFVDALTQFHQKWIVLIGLIGLSFVLLCAKFRSQKWIGPFWWFFVILTGLHTAFIIVSLFSGLTGFPAMAVMFLVMFSWPVTATFVVLLFVKPAQSKY